MSHYSNCSRTPVPPGHSLFQFLLGLFGRSFTSLPFSTHILSGSKQLLINLLSNNLPCPFSFLKSAFARWTNPLCVAGGVPHSWALSSSAPPQNRFSPWPLRRDAAWPKSQTSLSAPAVNGISHFYL